MSIIGNPLTSMAFVTDFFSGTGSTTAFTMSVAPANTASALVVISGVVQDPSAYAVAGTILTFSAAPPAGSNNISVRYLGLPANGVTTTAYRTVTEFTATASQTVFAIPSYTLGYINVYRNGVRLGTADYTATNGTTVVLANAATLGDLVTTESFYVSSVLNAIPAIAGQVGATYLAAGAASQAFLDSASGNGTGAMRLPVGSTAQRPTGSSGLIRQNSTTGNPEWWDGTTNNWQQFSQPAGYSVNYLVVAGGGGGAGTGVSTAGGGGGGGAGGLLTSSMTLSSGTSYTVTVGGGGAGGAGANSDSTGTAGTSSSFNLISTNGGGGGGDADKGHPGAAGGSGGGGGGGGGSAAGRVAGAGTNGQGYAGGAGYGVAQNYSGGGGGGAATLGVAGAAAIGGNGGAGSASSISGTATYYAGGGGGGINSNATNSGAIPGVGGLGGGGAGGKTAPGTAATANTGGGGGGGGGDTLNNGASGGSGVVIISYLGSQRGTGGGISSSGGYTIHTFTSSGTYNA